MTLEAAVNGLTERTCRVEEARPALERAMKDLGSMSATQEAIREALEQLREAREELTETRGRLDNTRSWLTDTERSVGDCVTRWPGSTRCVRRWTPSARRWSSSPRA